MSGDLSIIPCPMVSQSQFYLREADHTLPPQPSAPIQYLFFFFFYKEGQPYAFHFLLWVSRMLKSAQKRNHTSHRNFSERFH